MPYGVPWGWIETPLVSVPSSLVDGVLIEGRDAKADRARVEFVMLHEFGHLASKQYLHPEGPEPYSSVRWFEELLASYFAYAYVQASDPDWARASREEWRAVAAGYSPPVLSLDWGFIRGLAPAERARTYAWYQVMLNLWAAELYEEHGLDFLRAVRDRLPWETSASWTTQSLLPALEQIAPGSEAQASALQVVEPAAQPGTSGGD